MTELALQHGLTFADLYQRDGLVRLDRADLARKILKKFKIDINDASNGVFLPANKTTVNINGEAVHSERPCLGEEDDLARLGRFSWRQHRSARRSPCRA